MPRKTYPYENLDVHPTTVKLWYKQFLRKAGYREDMSPEEKKAFLGSFRIIKKEYTDSPSELNVVGSLESSMAFVPVKFEAHENTGILSDVDFSLKREYKNDIRPPFTGDIEQNRKDEHRRRSRVMTASILLRRAIFEAGKEENLPYFDTHFSKLIDDAEKEYLKAREDEVAENTEARLELLRQESVRNKELYDGLTLYNPGTDYDQLLQVTYLFEAAKKGQLYRMSADGDFSKKQQYNFNPINGGSFSEPEELELNEVLDPESEAENLFFSQVLKAPASVENGMPDKDSFTENQKEIYKNRKSPVDNIPGLTGKYDCETLCKKVKEKAGEVPQLDYKEFEKQRQAAEEKAIADATVNAGDNFTKRALELGISKRQIDRILSHEEYDLAAILDLEKTGYEGKAPMSEEEFRNYLIGEDTGLTDSSTKINRKYKRELNELGISADEIVSMAARSKKPLNEILNQFTAELDRADAELDRQYRELTGEMQEDFNNNVVDMAVYESYKGIRESFGEPGLLGDTRLFFAQFITAKAIQEKLDCEGRILAGDAGTKAQNLISDEKSWKKMMNDPKFNAYFEKYGAAEMKKIVDAKSDADLQEVYRNFKTGIKEKNLDSLESRIERISNEDDISLRTLFFTSDEVNRDGTWKKLPDNPNNLTITRSGLTSLAFCELCAEGYSMSDMLDPYKLNGPKLVAGQRALEDVAKGGPESRKRIRKLFTDSLEKCVEHIDRLMSGIKSFDLETLTSDKMRDIFRINNYAMDMFQDFSKVSEGRSDEEFERFDRISDKYMRTTTFTADLQRGILAINKLQKGIMNPEDVMSSVANNIIPLTQLGKVYSLIKTLPDNRGKSFVNTLEKGDAICKAAIGSSIAYQPLVCGGPADSLKMQKFFKNPENQKQLAKDILSGKLAADLDVQISRDPKYTLDFKVNGAKKFISEHIPAAKPKAVKPDNEPQIV